MTLSVQITHRLPRFALDIAFETGPGVTAIFGRSGAGKTTLINAVAGMLRPDAGRIVLDGDVLLSADRFVPPHRRRIGYVFQDGRLFPHLTVRQNLLFGRFFARGTEAPDRVIELLGLGPLLQRRPARLSGGEKQRVAIGRALLSAPRLLLMDEPLAALDDARKAEILPYLERLRAGGVPILYVSHSVAEVARLASKVVLLDEGRVRAIGTPSEILSNPDAGIAPGGLIAATVAAQEGDGLARLESSAGALFLHSAAPVGARLAVRVHAQDVLLSRRRPEGLSALNILAATVTGLTPAGHQVQVSLRVGTDALIALITRRSAETLGLSVGAECFAILKTAAIDQSASGGMSDGATTGVFSDRSR